MLARAGEPNWGPELLARHAMVGMVPQLYDLWPLWERWAAEVGESHTNFPVLIQMRSARPNRNWLVALLCVMDAAAIPAFARKYKVSCTTCHAPFPRLKPYGEEFAGRGFVMEAGQEPARATVDAGDELLQLPRELPLAIRVDAFGEWTPDADPQTQLQSPWVFKILTGGPVADGAVSYTHLTLPTNREV